MVSWTTQKDGSNVRWGWEIYPGNSTGFGLTQTCRQLCQESVPILYGAWVLLFDIPPDYGEDALTLDWTGSTKREAHR